MKPILLADDTISQQELESTAKWMLEGNRLTKSKLTTKFENEFADWIGSKHAVFVNSGSSANLLMVSAAMHSGRLRNKVAIAPAVSWVTTVSPLLQLGFDVRLCDCDPFGLGLDPEHLEELCKENPPSLLILVHVLGHVNKMKEIVRICQKYDIVLIEDSCEALGSEFLSRKLGTLSTAGSFSFYYGHHISTIEGGMVVTDDSELHQIMLSLRSHGWSRDLNPSKKDFLQKQFEIDDFTNLYTFYYPGFNLRSTDLQAHLGVQQLSKIDAVAKTRSINFERYKENLHRYFCQQSDTSLLSSFAYGTLISNREDVYFKLKKNQIECRPLICGNIARHPFWQKRTEDEGLIRANKVHDYGIYLPNHHNLSPADIDRVCEIFSQSATPISFS
jgi:CDP-4-dehydro-6-deoxyglucose reductase, E1